MRSPLTQRPCGQRVHIRAESFPVRPPAATAQP